MVKELEFRRDYIVRNSIFWNNKDRSGTGTPTVDMGAYEFQIQ